MGNLGLASGGPRIGRCDVVTTALQPEEESVAGQAPTELSTVESPQRPQKRPDAGLRRLVRHGRMTSTVSTKPAMDRWGDFQRPFHLL